MILIFFMGVIPSVMFFSNYWIVEKYETKIFVNLYKALEALQLYSEKKKVSKMYLSRATKRVKKAINALDRLCERARAINSVLSDKELCEPLEKLAENLKKQILPRFIQGKEIYRMQSTLRGLAKTFGEVTPIDLDQVASLNENLERYEEIIIREKTIKSIFRKVLISKPVALLSSILLGYFSVITVIFLFCQMLEMNLLSFMRDNLAVVISGGAVISGMYTAVFILKR